MDRPDSPSAETSPSWQSGARRRMPFYLLAAILMAVLAGVLTFTYLGDLRRAAIPTNLALVAAQDIRPGALINETMVELRQVPEVILPEGYLSSVGQAVGRTAVVPMVMGEVVLNGRLSGGADGGISARLPDGRWAMVLTGGWLVTPLPELLVGDRIELLAYRRGRPVEDAGVIVTGVEILQVGGPEASPNRLVIIVTLEEAIAILYAHDNGFSLLPLLRPQGG